MSRARDAAFLAVVALGVYGLKAHYRDASAADLRWILGPTVACVEALTGVEFEPESGSGYLSLDRSFLIAPICAGVNFLTAAFLTGCVAFFRGLRSTRQRVALVVASLAVAYAATVLANSLRIALSLWLRGVQSAPPHRLLGVLVYATCLFALFATVERLRSGRGRAVEMRDATT